jgi:FtsP/CotA-like multicopper oxidase with cupredoxin domain
MKLSRRSILGGFSAAPFIGLAHAQSAPDLRIVSRVLDVKGKAAKVYGIVGPNGKAGLEMVLGEPFRFNLKNEIDDKTLIHWHGLTPPTAQDGVPHLSSQLIDIGSSRIYDFENTKPGTHWMHSHLGLQEQNMLAAPLIVHELKKPLFDEQEHVVMLHDFTFRDPQEIMAELRGGGGEHAKHSMKVMDHSKMTMPMMNMAADVAYDAMLANDRTLDDPEILRAEKGGHIRLRIINASAATNMWIDLGSLTGALIAVDGNTVFPINASRFPLAIAQRADIRIALPNESGAWPVVFQSEGTPLRSGIIIHAGDAQIAKISDQGEPGAALDFSLEAQLHSAAQVLKEPVTHSEVVMLTGGDDGYNWGFNGKPMMHETLFSVREGERVEVMLHNMTAMAHPLHLHGHYFKVVGLSGKVIDGAVRDTVLIPAGENVTIQFDANNPGTWAFHCHHLYHMNSGMMAAVGYAGAA